MSDTSLDILDSSGAGGDEAGQSSAVAGSSSGETPVEKNDIAEDLKAAFDRAEGAEGSAEGSDRRRYTMEAAETSLSSVRDHAMKTGNYAHADWAEQGLHHVRLSHVEQFSNTHPHWDEVSGDILGLLTAAKQEGRRMSLADAYNFAVHANPATRAKVLEAKTDTKTGKSKPKDDIRADLEAAFAKHA